MRSGSSTRRARARESLYSQAKRVGVTDGDSMSTVEIKPPSQFHHAGMLSARWDRPDPREDSFAVEHMDIDLRECEFVRPPAALWCAVYLALASRRGCHCRLLVPSNMGVCSYLASLGLFSVLRDLGIEVDDRDVHPGNPEKIVLPLTPFTTAAEASDLTNRAADSLSSSNLGPVNLTTIVTELFSELALNAAEHSRSPFGAMACIQFAEFSEGPRFACTVADGGIGILESLRRNEALRRRISYDWDALELAIRERVSGTGHPHRGIGLYGVSEDVRVPGRSLLLHSGLGTLAITEELESSAKRSRLFPGMLAHLTIST